MAESTCEVAKDRLSHLQTGELERCVGDHKVIGIALILTKGEAIVAIFGNERLIGQTTVVKRGLNLVGVPTGKKLQGRVIDALGNVIDGLDVTKREESKLYAIAEAPVSPAYRGTINNSFGIVGMISAEIVGGINRAINNYKQEELNRRASELTSSEAEMLDIQIYQDQAKVYTSSRAG
jgi:flagellar biosynthesis/type III secretory pathway ATPase